MRDRKTVFGLTFLTILVYETKSTLHCHHIPFLAYTSSNTVNPSLVSDLLGLKISDKKVKNTKQFKCSEHYMAIIINRIRKSHSSQSIDV